MPRTPRKRQASEARINDMQGPTMRPRNRTGESTLPNNIPIVETIDLTRNSPLEHSRPKKNRTNIVITLDLDTTFEITSPQSKKKEQTSFPTTVAPDVVEVTPTPTVEKVYPLGDCPICFEVLGKNQLASTRCGHVFCLHCLERSMTHGKFCPSCRKSLKGPNTYHPLFIRIS